ncbi:MAG TPA: NAD(P)/FAD-dependent oxidoreductase [Vicinamibacteria bacterium]
MYDLLIVGGGPAGLATSIFAASEGFEVALLERRRFPVDKPCGEGLMPGGVRLLEAMGARIERSRPFEGIRYIDGGSVAEARFRDGHGLGVRRTELSRGLLARARELGVAVREETRVEAVIQWRDSATVSFSEGSLDAKWVAVADGLGSLVPGGSPRAGRVGRVNMRRYGFRRHYRLPPWSTFVEVHWGEGAEAYVTPVGEDEVGVAILWHERAPSWEAMLSRFPHLEKRLRGAEAISSIQGAGPFRRRPRRVRAGRLALVGDASGYVDAITGDGIALAFECARELTRSLKEGSLAAYERAHRRAMRRYRGTAELVLALAAYPRLRRGVVRALAGSSILFERLLGLAQSNLKRVT